MLENVDYYYENGRIVLTAFFLLKRGKCCKGGCRHCPYGFNRVDDHLKHTKQDFKSTTNVEEGFSDK